MSIHAKQRAAADEPRRIVVIDHAKCKPGTPAFDSLQRAGKSCVKGCISVAATGSWPYK
jgi:hypothetical protein